jgi:hypothetical protein
MLSSSEDPRDRRYCSRARTRKLMTLRNGSIEVPSANVHVQVYRFWTKPETSFALALATVNRSGGPFQAMIQTQRVIAADDPIDPEIPLEPPKPVSMAPQ